MKRIDVPMRQRISTECNRYPHLQLCAHSRKLVTGWVVSFLWGGLWFREFCWWVAEYIAKATQMHQTLCCRDQSSIRLCGWRIYREVCGDEHELWWEPLSLVWLGSPTLWSACLNACKHPHLSIVLHAMLICWHVTRRIGVTCPNYNIFTISHLSNVARRLSTCISPTCTDDRSCWQDQTHSLS